jgi:hypothetical protein
MLLKECRVLCPSKKALLGVCASIQYTCHASLQNHPKGYFPQELQAGMQNILFPTCIINTQILHLHVPVLHCESILMTTHTSNKYKGYITLH